MGYRNTKKENNIRNYKTEIVKALIILHQMVHFLSVLKVNVYYKICRYSKFQANTLFKGRWQLFRIGGTSRLIMSY